MAGSYLGGVAPFVRKKPDGPLRVMILGRVSTEHQNIENIDASYAEVERELRKMYDGPTEIKHFGERASGFKVHRPSIVEAEEEIQSGKWDLVIMEDLGRAHRNPQYQYRLAQMCVDHRTRLICVRDGIDTANPNWELILSAAVIRHASTVPETRGRVKRTATWAFHHGGMVLKVPFAYRRLTQEQASSGEFGPRGLRMAKVRECTAIIHEMRVRVLRGESYAAIAEWLNDFGVAPGVYATRGVWTGQLVADFLRDPLLQGLRTFRDVEYELLFSTGEHRRNRNENPETEFIPELAFMTKEEQEELWAAMDKHAPKRGEHPRKGTARKMTLWPGQHLKCAICGDELYWYSRGTLKCRNAYPGRPPTCWNHVQVDAEQVRMKVLAELLHVVRDNPDLLELLVDAAWKEFQRKLSRTTRRRTDVEAQIRECEQDVRRITTLLVKRPDSDSLLERLDTTEQHLRELRASAAELQRESADEALCTSREEVLERLDEVVLHLARTSYSFDLLMARMFPDFRMYPVQALDTPQVRPRIKLVAPPLSEGGVPMEVVVDAFEAPQHIRWAPECQRIHAAFPDLTLQQIGRQLGIGKKVVCQALKFAHLMESQDSRVAYVELSAPPATASRWRQRRMPGNPTDGIAAGKSDPNQASDGNAPEIVPGDAA